MILAFIIFFSVLVIIFLKIYLFNTYETKLIIVPEKEIYNVNDEISLEIIDLNGFGMKIPFSKNESFVLNIISGNENITITDSAKTKIISLKKIGIVKLSISSKNSLMPIYKEINIK